ncbi:N-acetylmuramoyl-L-alanine amidase [Siminovitchia sp. 179-K 8D1 HS]|uniref:N-acetylmuramoyl-L-alanine amidase n=1 Tax=Siminovitchia sp. 179-K 8D1 HS TaxID=3142385 RepID=UPI00399F473D
MKRKFVLMVMAIALVVVPYGKVAEAQSAKKVVIDAGHGGKDTGATGNGLREKDLTLKIAQKVNRILTNNYVVNAKMTRNSDVSLTLDKRTDFANRWGADLFLSIHINSGSGTGYEDYIHTTSPPTSEDKKVQTEINKEIKKVLEEYKKINRGQKKANFYVLRESKMASVLLEILFIDNKSDAKLLKNEQFLNDMAEAIATGVAKALALEKKDNSVTGTSAVPEGKIVVSKAGGTYVVTASSVPVRAGDGTNYPVVGSLRKNEQVNVTGVTSKGWYQVTFKGKAAYVSKTHLKLKPAQKQKSEPIKVAKASGTYIVTANSLNVRLGNGSSYRSLGILKKNDQVHVTGKTSNNWYRMTLNGKTGYVSGAYLKKKPVPKQKNAMKVTKASGTYKVTASTLNVRSGNAASYSKIGSLARGTKVKVTGKTSNGWYRINHKGKVGYVSGKYLKR